MAHIFTLKCIKSKGIMIFLALNAFQNRRSSHGEKQDFVGIFPVFETNKGYTKGRQRWMMR